LSASEWLDWQRFYSLEPYGAPLADIIQAQLRVLLANINRNDKVRPEPFRTEEFLLLAESEAAPSEPAKPELIEGLTLADWRLALYLRALGKQQTPPDGQE